MGGRWQRPRLSEWATGARCALRMPADGMPVLTPQRDTTHRHHFIGAPAGRRRWPVTQWVELDGESQESSLQAGFERCRSGGDAERIRGRDRGGDRRSHDAMQNRHGEQLTDAGWGLAQGQGPQRVCYRDPRGLTERGAGIAVLRLASSTPQTGRVEHHRIVIVQRTTHRRH